MSRVTTFSRTFPSYHPKAGQPTYFVEKILTNLFRMPHGLYYGNELVKDQFTRQYFGLLCSLNHPDKHHECVLLRDSLWDLEVGSQSIFEKGHTIRSGHRWKEGDWFSPRVWSGKPYNSKMIQFAPDIQVKKVWDFEMKPALFWDECKYLIDGKQIMQKEILTELSKNDGLTPNDFALWFAGKNMADSKRKPFQGQIICWNENINY